MTQRSHNAAAREKSLAVAASPLALPADAIAAARDICDAYEGGVQRGGGIPAVAAKIGISAGVLYNKLSGSEDAHHKLTVRDMVLVWLVTGRIEHLQALSRTMNCLCFQAPGFTGLSDQALLDLLCKVQEEAGHFHAALKLALADGRISAEERAVLRREAYEWMGAIAEADARLESLVSG